MTMLPSRKLTIGELFVSLAAGLMLFLLPNDAMSQFEEEAVRESFVFVMSAVIVTVMLFLIKRYEAVGVCMIVYSVLTLLSTIIGIINGAVTKGDGYWPKLSEYNVICMLILWMTPFISAVIVRLLAGGKGDNNNTRRSFARFMNISMWSLEIIFGIILIMKMILPKAPDNDGDRQLLLGLFDRVGACITGEYESGIKYILFHIIMIMPLTFHLSVMIQKIRVWHIIIIALSFGLTVEALQYIFNTSAACVDDLILYLIGTIAAVLIRAMINELRSVLTCGEDKDMLSFEFTHIRKNIPENPTGTDQPKTTES